MPIEITCTGCNKRLRVPDRTAGKRVKCPKCQSIIAVPDSNLPDQWNLKGEDGEVYGPVPRSELDQWYAEGRITADCQVLQQEADQWQWATDLYPDLVPEEPVQSETFSLTGDPTPDGSSPASEFDFGADPSPSARYSRGGSSKGRKSARKSKGDSISTTEEESTEISPKKKITAGLLGLFLGGLGVHRFYLGYTGMGFLILLANLTIIGGALWGLIEGIRILTGSFNRDAQGRLLKS